MIKYHGIPGALIASILRASRVGAFDGEPQWKKDAEGKLAVDAAGNPIYIDSNGKEGAFEASAVTRLNGEAAGNRKRAETAEANLKLFQDAGITDPKATADLLKKYKDVDLSKLVDAGKLDEVKAAIQKAHDEEKTKIVGERDGLANELNGLRLSTAFMGSQFIKDKTILPPDIAMKTFGTDFAWDNGRFVAKKSDGTPYYSEKRPGELADFDEALSMIVNNYPAKAAILKGGNGSGSGNGGDGGSGGGGKPTYRRDEFAKLPASEQARIAGLAREGKAELTD